MLIAPTADNMVNFSLPSVTDKADATPGGRYRKPTGYPRDMPTDPNSPASPQERRRSSIWKTIGRKLSNALPIPHDKSYIVDVPNAARQLDGTDSARDARGDVLVDDDRPIAEAAADHNLTSPTTTSATATPGNSDLPRLNTSVAREPTVQFTEPAEPSQGQIDTAESLTSTRAIKASSVQPVSSEGLPERAESSATAQARSGIQYMTSCEYHEHPVSPKTGRERTASSTAVTAATASGPTQDEISVVRPEQPAGGSVRLGRDARISKSLQESGPPVPRKDSSETKRHARKRRHDSHEDTLMTKFDVEEFKTDVLDNYKTKEVNRRNEVRRRYSKGGRDYTLDTIILSPQQEQRVVHKAWKQYR